MIPGLREKVSITLAWTKIVVLGLVALYTLIFLIINRNAKVTPGLNLIFTKYEDPNALLTLFVASTITVVLSYLALSLYRSVHVLRALQRDRRTRDIAAGLETLRKNPDLVTPKAVNVPPVNVSAASAPKVGPSEGPIPLE